MSHTPAPLPALYASKTVSSNMQRRTVFSDVNRREPPVASEHPPVPAQTTEKAKETEKQRLNRQNTKTPPPSPPQVIRDLKGTLALTRVGFLGEGGFARVYEVKDVKGTRGAVKVVTKASLKSTKAKTKLYAEIKIHRSLRHPNIVRFYECFEDESNVYMTLQLCDNGSLMNMLRRRKRLTELETRYFMVQVIGACHFMHAHQVIHRDLKLGNLLLDGQMNIKVGDFGLAALIENPGERKKTICGTPNYIAPEVLFDTTNGHSFEVDVWSIGVIMYTLVIGRPPFQTTDVKAIYKRIRDNEYEFPSNKQISLDTRDLIQQILTTDPQARPTLPEILDHPFFVHGVVPPHIPVTAHDTAPYFQPPISRQQSLSNLARLRKYALLDQGETIDLSASADPRDPGLRAGPATTLAQQEREFKKAVQPGSPISALLSSARQPLIVSNSPSPREKHNMVRKLNHLPPLSGKGKQSVISPHKIPLTDIREEEDGEEATKPNRELESQKARIVAQMVPTAASSELAEEQENIPPVLKKTRSRRLVHMSSSMVPPAVEPKPDELEALMNTLSIAFEAKEKGKLFKSPVHEDALELPKVFIVSWVDYCNKYGMGYALTDGSVGVHFNDGSSTVLAADKSHFDYIIPHKHTTPLYSRRNHTVTDYPENLKAKVYLIKHFEKYMMERLYGEYDYTYQDLERNKDMDFVEKYYREKHVIVFQMSHGVFQFNFYDHTKIIISSQGLLITHIDKNYIRTRWPLTEVMRHALLPPHQDPAKVKMYQRLLERLSYCRGVLIDLRNTPSGAHTDGTTPTTTNEAPLR